MGEQFEAGAGVCGGGNWWNTSRTGFESSPCNSSINMNNHIESYGWEGKIVEINGGGRSSDDSSDGNVAGDAMCIGLSSSSSSITDWNQSLIRANVILQEELNYHQETPPPVNNFDDQVNFPTSYGYPSNLLQTLFDSNSPPEQSGFDTGPMNYSSTTNNYRTSLSEFLPSTLPKLSYNMVKPKQQVSSQLHLSNSTPFWNATSTGPSDIRATFFSSSEASFEEKPNCANLTTKLNHEEIRNPVSVKKGCSEPVFKRPRFETPSPLPTFKVRKEKLGDRITALQQLVSPFGKTDTASVLHEAIEYIKLLHDQVNVLSTPYMKNGASMQSQQNQEKVKEREGGGAKQDLKGRGLCLVPVSSTFPVAAETTADFWTPNFGGAFH